MNKQIKPELMAKSINEIVKKSTTLDFIEDGLLHAVTGDRIDLKTWTFDHMTIDLRR